MVDQRLVTGRHATKARRGRALAGLVMLLALSLTGCSSGGDSESAGDAAEPASAGAQDGFTLDTFEGESTEAGGRNNGRSSGEAPARPLVQTRSVISTGQVQLEAEDLVEVRSQVERLLGRFGGFIAREETHSDEDGRTALSTLQLRVPSQNFDTMMSSFADFATVVDAGRKAEDVTTEVIDVDSRIRTQEISLERLRTFLGRATKVADMIRLESEIARREADLASLRAQQDFLADQTSLATITVEMTLPPEEAEEDDVLADAGFLTGLRNGWEALTNVAVVGATAIGVMLPFLGVLALVLVPLLVRLRTGPRRGRPVSPPPPAAPPPT